MGEAMEITRVLETCLYAIDLGTAEQFYTHVLGMHAFARVEGRHVFFRCGNGVFLLFNPTRTAEPGGDVPPHGAYGPGHVAFAVDRADLPQWRGRLEASGIEIEADVTWPSGAQSLYFRDPAGNSVELTSPEIWR